MTIDELKKQYEEISCEISETERMLLGMGAWNSYGRTLQEYKEFDKMIAKYEIDVEIKKRDKENLKHLILNFVND